MDRNIKDKIEKLKHKQEVLKARIQLMEAREKTNQRKLDTRKKILIGSYFLGKYTEDNNLDELKTIMDKYLIRDSDRKVFDLEIVDNGCKK